MAPIGPRLLRLLSDGHHQLHDLHDSLPPPATLTLRASPPSPPLAARAVQTSTVPGGYTGLHSGLSPGAVVGITLGSVAAFLFLVGLLYAAVNANLGFWRRGAVVVEKESVRTTESAYFRRRPRSGAALSVVDTESNLSFLTRRSARQAAAGLAAAGVAGGVAGAAARHHRHSHRHSHRRASKASKSSKISKTSRRHSHRHRPPTIYDEEEVTVETARVRVPGAAGHSRVVLEEERAERAEAGRRRSAAASRAHSRVPSPASDEIVVEEDATDLSRRQRRRRERRRSGEDGPPDDEIIVVEERSGSSRGGGHRGGAGSSEASSRW